MVAKPFAPQAPTRAETVLGPLQTGLKVCAPNQPLVGPLSRQNLPVDILAPLCHYRAMLDEAQNQFSLTRAALGTCGRPQSNSLSVLALAQERHKKLDQFFDYIKSVKQPPTPPPS